jgi:hypothetical protein
MKFFGRWTGLLILSLALWTLGAGARGAGAITLDALASGGSFSTGVLTFSAFEVTLGGDLPADLATYPVQVLEGGFRLSGPLSVLFGDVGTLILSYDVSVSDPSGILGVSLFADPTVIGAGSQAYVGESIFGPGDVPVGSLFVYGVAGFGEDPLDALALAGPTQVHVATTITVRSGTFAAVPFVDQRFVVVAEPVSLGLIASGLAGLALFGRPQTRTYPGIPRRS